MKSCLDGDIDLLECYDMCDPSISLGKFKDKENYITIMFEGNSDFMSNWEEGGIVPEINIPDRFPFKANKNDSNLKTYKLNLGIGVSSVGLNNYEEIFFGYNSFDWVSPEVLGNNTYNAKILNFSSGTSSTSGGKGVFSHINFHLLPEFGLTVSYDDKDTKINFNIDEWNITDKNGNKIELRPATEEDYYKARGQY